MRLGQVMIDIEGLELSSEDQKILTHPQVGGLILFRRNYTNLKQLGALINNIRAIRPEIIIAVDQEGGRVQRFIEEFTRLSPLGDIGAVYDQDPTKAIDLAKTHARVMATELLSLGIDLSFTPVLDRNIGLSSVIGDRSFHAQTKVITELATHYIQTMHDVGMPATGKHFPGHGAVKPDSHIELPVDTRDFQTIFETDLQPFMALAQRLDAVMIAHVVYQEVSDLPAGFDRYWLHDVLREQCGFKGVVFSDALDMGALKDYGTMTERATRALEAGCDMVLVCNDRKAAKEVLEDLGDKINQVSANRLESFMSRYRQEREHLQPLTE